MFNPLTPPVEAQNKPVEIGEQTASPQLGLNMGRSLGQMVLILVVILVLVNIPTNTYGFGLAHLLPQATPLVIHDDLLLKLMDLPPMPWGQWLCNPLWYVVTVALVAMLTFYFRSLWWLAGVIALLWGAWLIWQLFQGENAETHDGKQPDDYLIQALIYKAQIDQLFKTTPPRSQSVQRQQLTAQINLWIEAIRRLVQHLDRLRQDPLIHHDLLTVPQAIAALETQLAQESDPLLRSHLERTLLQRQNQLASLELLQYNLKQVEIQLESTLSLFGVLYSQLLAGHTTRHLADYRRISLDVDEEVQRLQDHLEALREVKSQPWPGTR